MTKRLIIFILISLCILASANEVLHPKAIELWKYSSGDLITDIIINDNKIYFSTGTSYYGAIDMHTGKQIW